jgi:hypothetical protein
MTNVQEAAEKLRSLTLAQLIAENTKLQSESGEAPMSTKQQAVEGSKIKQLERRIEYLQRVISVWKGRYRKVAKKGRE